MENEPLAHDIPEDVDSRFRFVLLAATRAEQLMRGAVPKLANPGVKVTTNAVNEIQEGLIAWGYGPAPVEEAVEEYGDEDYADEAE